MHNKLLEQIPYLVAINIFTNPAVHLNHSILQEMFAPEEYTSADMNIIMTIHDDQHDIGVVYSHIKSELQ